MTALMTVLPLTIDHTGLDVTLLHGWKGLNMAKYDRIRGVLWSRGVDKWPYSVIIGP